jgi:signal recognition particle receptor subunit beta
MASALSDQNVLDDAPPVAVKIVIGGGFGAGKTTFVGSISETMPLLTEEYLTDQSVGVDDTAAVEHKGTTTIVMDFGRITISHNVVLYLFGTPGQDRFLFLWDELALGAVGAVVVADTRRLADCFPSLDYFERRGTPFVVAVNCFDGVAPYTTDEVRTALNLGGEVPVLLCDARERDSARDVLIALVERAMDAVRARQAAQRPD